MSAKTILYIEDNEMNRKIVRDLLKRTKYALIEAHDGERADHQAQRRAHWLRSAVIHRVRAGASFATKRASLWVTAALALTNTRRFDELLDWLPCTFRDSQVRWPLDSPHETRCAEGAGRLKRLTGWCARQMKPERRSMSSPQGLPAREVLLQP